MSIYLNKNVNKFANNNNVRKFTKKLCSPSALLPVVLLEGAVTIGRTYQAEQRGGKIEARERLTEESISGIVWLWGMNWINKGFDFAIDKVGGLKKATQKEDFKFDFDTGKDNIRKPFEHATKGLSDKSKNIISALKFSKIVASAALAVGFMGIVVPKFNQKITTDMLKKEKEAHSNDNNPAINKNNSSNSQKERKTPAKAMDLTTFLAMSRGAEGDPKQKTPFKGGAFFQTAAHQLENNSITQLLTMDTGLFTGRAVSARNKYERQEILFRDLSSSFFYVGATPLIYNALNAIDKHNGKNTRLDPHIAGKLDAQMRKKLNLKGSKDKVSVAKFERLIKGKRIKGVSEDVVSDAHNMFQAKKEKVNLDKMHKFLDDNISDKSLSKTLKNKASKLSELQPELDGKSIFTKHQVHSLFHDGLLNEPEFINGLINDATEGVAKNPIKFIKQSKVDTYRKHINDYADSILERVNRQDLGEISTKLLDQMKNRNLVTKLGYWGAGMAVSAYFLSTAIPKMQYAMTKKATGSDEFPGIIKYD